MHHTVKYEYNCNSAHILYTVQYSKIVHLLYSIHKQHIILNSIHILYVFIDWAN